MDAVRSSKLDKIAHEIFAGTLRSASRSPRDEAPNSRSLRYAEKIASLAHKLADPRTLKLNLLKIPQLRTLSTVDSDFLKAAVPVLACASRPYNSAYTLEHGTAILNKWAGFATGAVAGGSAKDVSELLISPQAFKNALLKLLNGTNDDNRIVTMRRQLTGQPWSASIDDCVATAPMANDDDIECTFHPRLNKYPLYLKNAPKRAFPKATIAGQLKQMVSELRRPMDDDIEFAMVTPDPSGQAPDYSSPFNRHCPFGSALCSDPNGMNAAPQKLPGVCELMAKFVPRDRSDPSIHVAPCVCSSTCRAPQISYGGVGATGASRCDPVEAAMASVPGIVERLPRPLSSGVGEARLRFISPHRNHLCSDIGNFPEQCAGSAPGPWEEALRGGYIRTGMRFSIDQHPRHGIEVTCGKSVGSLKQCDYILPQRMIAPAQKNEAYSSHAGHRGTTGTPLDMIEAQLAQPVVDVLRMHC